VVAAAPERLNIRRVTLLLEGRRILLTSARFRVIVTRRQKYGRRSCADWVRQAAAPARLIGGCQPTKPLAAYAPVGDYADPLPTYRRPEAPTAPETTI
jgi:transposase